MLPSRVSLLVRSRTQSLTRSALAEGLDTTVPLVHVGLCVEPPPPPPPPCPTIPEDGPQPPPPPPPPPPPRQPRGFTVSQLDDGFRVSIASRSQNRYRAGDAIRLAAAYEVARGNPLSLYQPHDFRLHGDGGLAVQVEGAESSPGSAGNELALQIADAGQFSITVRGFDPLRDVYVSVDRVAAIPAEDGEGDDDSSV